MADRDVVDKASKAKFGDRFLQLYNGGTLFNNEDKDERSLMTRLAMYVGGDSEQLLRVFRSSGQFREAKPNAVYQDMAKSSIEFVAGLRGNLTSDASQIQPSRQHAGVKTKT
jgi:hypothetical protein